jgi:hypothetical protein
VKKPVTSEGFADIGVWRKEESMKRFAMAVVFVETPGGAPPAPVRQREILLGCGLAASTEIEAVRFLGTIRGELESGFTPPNMRETTRGQLARLGPEAREYLENEQDYQFVWQPIDFSWGRVRVLLIVRLSEGMVMPDPSWVARVGEWLAQPDRN